MTKTKNNTNILVAAFCAAMLMLFVGLAVSRARATTLTVGSACGIMPGETFELSVHADDANDLFAYELHVAIEPLEGQDPNTMFFAQGYDVILNKYNPGQVISFNLEDGLAASIFNGTAVNDINEPTIATLEFQCTGQAYGRYEIRLLPQPETQLVNGNVEAIPFTTQHGYANVTPTQPAADFTGDWCVCADDLAFLAGQWLTFGLDPPNDCPEADIGGGVEATGDCVVNLPDLAAMLGEWDGY